jgi:hypothetical protein
MHRWHEAISVVLLETFAETGKSPEMTYEGISRACIKLRGSWLREAPEKDEITGNIKGISQPAEQGKPAISSWYITLTNDQEHWRAIAGCGDAYEASRNHDGQTLPPPHSIARDRPAWKAAVVQDFQKWSERVDVRPYPHGSEALRRGIGSWLAVPMQVDGVVRALMVVHSPHRCYFTEQRTRLMEHAAKRLLPLLAAAQRETRARSAFTAAIMHEVKNDAHSALMVLEGLEQQLRTQTNGSRFLEPLIEIRHFMKNLHGLGQDALGIYRLGDKEQPLEQQTSGQSIETRLRDLLENLLLTRLDLRIRNPAFTEVAHSLLKKMDQAGDTLGNAATARGRLGLAVARQLTAEAEGSLNGPETTVLDGDYCQITVTLRWPISLIKVPMHQAKE